MPVRGTLPAGPFLAWADSLDVDLGVIGGAAMGFQAGALTRYVYRARHEQSTVSLRTVDHYFTAAGEPHQLALLYPQDVESMEDRWCPTCVELVTAGDDGLCPWCNTTVDEPRAAARRTARGELAQTSSMSLAGTDERRRRAKQMRAEGMRYRDICAELGVAKSTVSGYVNSADETT